ncbi:response regulator transcription factor [Clostridium estertheticum]|uniref:response regulator transcription factor n=1 Tax=Clostridium estertheticum TaxID=238834 RepID=UPI0013EE7EE6|nr:response regulator transcription factor [Clostridium estertheticum]MBZ9607966.1 response regulator transcription factor [Clostridium estertheticum]
MNETILIVDDEERIRNLVSIYLRKEQYNILQAENGNEAVNIFNKNKVDLIILDVMMPIMDGWDVCKEIRKTSNIPVIMLTAKSEEDDELLGFELGTDHYITKPFVPKLLVAKVKAIIRRTYSTEPVLKEGNNFDGLVVDNLSHEVTVDNSEIYLSPKEFELLNYFILNKSIVLSREKILDALWGIDYFGDLRTVDTVIKRLREKLGEKSYLIATIRGAGYKFEAKNEK